MTSRPSILFAHGAGLGSGSPWMVSWAERLGTLGGVVTFDYPYMAAGRKLPDRLPRLIEAHRDALGGLTPASARPRVLVGKSMGSRVGCHVALQEPVAALVCLGYPLVGRGTAKRPGPVRDEVLLALRTPVLFVQGTRDPLCPLDRLEALRTRMGAPNALHVVEGGDHSLRVPARGARSQAEVDAETLEAIARWLAGALRAG